jgi:hypothetical protein
MRPTLRNLVPALVVLATTVACIGYLVGGGVSPLQSPWVLTFGLTNWVLVAWLARVVGHGRLLPARAPTSQD